jgi:RNA polymerase sigma factor (sigma-70 family)
MDVEPAAVVSEGNTVVVDDDSTTHVRPAVPEPPRITVPAKPVVTAAKSANVPVTSSDAIESLYLEYRTLLLYVGCKKFRVPDTDAENLIQEVFLSYIQNITPIENVKAWLVAAMCNASRHYWRVQGRTESLPEDFEGQSDPGSHALADQFAMRMTLQKALKYLQPRCRETLWLHYFEGRSASDVAGEMHTTTRYAEKLIHNCLKRVREIYHRITKVKR